MAVNEDQRIGIFASNSTFQISSQFTTSDTLAEKDIPAGAELFMDYGPEYPIGDKHTK